MSGAKKSQRLNSVRCDECGGAYFSNASPMAALCPECAHRLYGYPNCTHEFVRGHCINCGRSSAAKKAPPLR